LFDFLDAEESIQPGHQCNWMLNGKSLDAISSLAHHLLLPVCCRLRSSTNKGTLMRGLIPIRLFSTLLFLLVYGPLAAAENVDAVAFFDAIQAGQIEVKFIPLNAAKANVLIQNKTASVLHLELPEAIAAVPVLAQFGQGPGQGLGQNGGQNGGGGATQGVGGGLNGGGGGQGNLFGGGGGGNAFGRGGGQGDRMQMGFMRIAPRKTRKLTATTVCLEHGKPDPHPRIAYRMIPIEKFTDNSKVVELCRQLGRGLVRQQTAQAIAWNLANGLSWEKLANINRIESRYLGNIKFFQRKELARAKQWVEKLSDPEADTTGNGTSLSRYAAPAR
jgi:hypothetical protein